MCRCRKEHVYVGVVLLSRRSFFAGGYAARVLLFLFGRRPATPLHKGVYPYRATCEFEHMEGGRPRPPGNSNTAIGPFLR